MWANPIVFILLTTAWWTMAEKIQIGDEDFDYDPELFKVKPNTNKNGQINPLQILETANGYINIISNTTVMGSLETVLRESYKFIRLADDLHEIKTYLNDIRLCFIALTVSGYVGILLYALIMCITKRRRDQANRRPQSRSDEEMGWRPRSDDEYHNTPLRTPEGYRYARQQNRNFQSSLQNTKLDSVDNPTKQQLIVENHSGTNVPITGVFKENGGPGIERIPAN